MLALDDAVALSLWYAAPRPQILDAIQRQPDSLTLEAVIDIVGGDQSSADLSGQLRRQAARALSAARRLAIDALALGDQRYPPLLAAVPDAPLVVWLKGDPATLSQPAVAIVGSRAATPYGLEAAARLAGDLSAAGALVVSGLARGVDSAAHRGALDAGGQTAAVLGSGVDVVYPPEHKELARAIAVRGAVLSEWPPGTPPRAFHFPARNRIISGLSLAVVVVEAAEKSGSLITAGCALEQGRAVLAVPGNILSGRHRGCHGLIRDGAAVVESVDDILAEIRAGTLRQAARNVLDATPADELLACMQPGESYDPESLGREAELSTSQLLSRLLDLELRGLVRRVGGGRFVRASRTC
jgi:DNA processing protein